MFVGVFHFLEPLFRTLLENVLHLRARETAWGDFAVACLFGLRGKSILLEVWAVRFRQEENGLAPMLISKNLRWYVLTSYLGISWLA